MLNSYACSVRFTRSDDAIDGRQDGVLKNVGGRQRAVRRGDAHQRAVEIVERLVGMIDMISAPQPHSRGFSSTLKQRCVLATEPRMVWVSSGTSDRTSMTSQSMPCSAASFSAAAKARGTIKARAMMVASFAGAENLGGAERVEDLAVGTSPLVA